MTDYRAHFDFDIRFANGGELSGTGFRLDLPSAEVSEAEIGGLLVQHLGRDTAADAGGERPAHTLLLGAGVHVVEHLTNLGALPPTGARFAAAPPAIEGFGTFPVRAFAELP